MIADADATTRSAATTRDVHPGGASDAAGVSLTTESCVHGVRYASPVRGRWFSAPARLSLRVRLMLLAVLLLAVGLTLTNIVLVGALQRYQIDRLDRQLQTVGEFLARRDPPGLNSDTTSRTVLPRVGLIGDVYIAYLNADGTTDRLLGPVR